MAERVKVGSAYICVDGDPSCAAYWPGVMNLCITVHGALILRECYFAQSNYSSIFTQQRLSSIHDQYVSKCPPLLITELTNTRGSVCKSTSRENHREESNDMTGSTIVFILQNKS